MPQLHRVFVEGGIEAKRSRNYIAVGVLYIYLKLRYMLNNISVEQHQITAEQLRIFSQILFKNDKN